MSSPVLQNLDSKDCAILNVKKPLGHTSMKHHLYAVQQLHHEQVERGKTTVWSQCYTLAGQQIMTICEKRVKLIKEMNNEEKDDNMLIAYNSVEGIADLFDYLYVDVESQSSYRKKYEILRSTAIMSATMFGAMRGEMMFDANLSDMNFLNIQSTDPSRIVLLLIRIVAGM